MEAATNATRDARVDDGLYKATHSTFDIQMEIWVDCLQT